MSARAVPIGHPSPAIREAVIQALADALVAAWRRDHQACPASNQ